MAQITIIPESIQLVKMTDAEYFSAPYREYISNSKLGLLNPDEGGSPEKYEQGFKEGYSESFELGSAIHAMVLQPDEYHIAEINKPSGKLGLFAEAVFKFRQQGLTIAESISKASIDADYYAASFSPTRIKTAIRGSLSFYLQRINFVEDLRKKTLFLSSPMQFKFQQCMLGIAENPDFTKTLYPEGLLQNAEFFNEYAILCEVEYVDEETGEIIRLKLKAKLDNFTVNHETQTITLNDLKSTGKPVKYFMGNHVKTVSESGEEIIEWYEGSFQKYHYYRQMGMYLWLLQCTLKTLFGYDYKLKANILAIETTPEFKSSVFAVTNKQIQSGLNEFKKLITMLVEWKKQLN